MLYESASRTAQPSGNSSVKVRWLWALLFLGICACSSSAPRKNADLATGAGVTLESLPGQGFRHAVYAREQPSQGSEKALHVYIGGDGRAFLHRRRVAMDPTAYPDRGLQLMLGDPGGAYFVARPCYHGTVTDQGCGARLWTTGRYSQEVVNSVAAVIETLHRRHPHQGVRLIGYSGGGVIAVLAARQLPFVRAVITIASPLDSKAWTERHGYSPLIDSINPAEIDHWPPNLQQLHLIGGADDNVTLETQSGFRVRMETLSQPAEFVVIPGQSHCCWSESWRRILQEQVLVN